MKGTGHGPAPAPQKPRRRLRDTLLTGAVVVMACIVGVTVFNSILMPRWIHRQDEMQLPDLTHLTVAQAHKVLETSGLPLVQAGERFDPGTPRGRIIAQSPLPGTFVRPPNRVSVTVSLGEEFASVPALFGESQRSGEVLLAKTGLTIGGITRAPSEAVGEGLIVATDPPAETVLPQGAPVALLVSTGLGEDAFVMPNLVGRDLANVRAQLEGLGFRVQSPGTGVGPVVAQDPPPGARITRATDITLQSQGRLIR